MTDLVKTAEQFYAVAEHLKRDAQFTLACADMLERHADSLCQMNMKNEKHPMDQASQGKTGDAK